MNPLKLTEFTIQFYKSDGDDDIYGYHFTFTDGKKSYYVRTTLNLPRGDDPESYIRLAVAASREDAQKQREPKPELVKYTVDDYGSGFTYRRA